MRILKVAKTELLPLFVLATLGLNILSVFWLAANTIAIYRESLKEIPTLVQLVDGRPVRVAAMGNRERSPETIVRFVKETLTLMFNWSGQLPPTNRQETQSIDKDLGKQIGSNANQVTTASWQAGFAFSEDFRTSFLSKVATLTPREVFSGNAQAVLIIRHISEPELLEKGRWKVQLIGELAFFNATDDSGRAIPFNKEVFVQAVAVPVSPLGESASVLEKTVYGIRQAGLEVYALRELSRKNL